MTTQITNKYKVNTTAISAGVTISLFGENPEDSKMPRVFYERDILETIEYLVHKCSKEVGWWGLVRREPGTMDFYIYKIYVPEQTVSGAETDISAEAMGKLAEQIITENLPTEDLYYWGHSHVNMAVGPSGQDERQVEEYLPNVDFFIRGIYNKSGNSKVDVYDVKRGIAFQCVPNVKKDHGLDETTVAALDELIKDNVKERVYSTTSYTGTSTYNPNRAAGDGVLNTKFDGAANIYVIGRGAAEYVEKLKAERAATSKK